MFTLEIIDPAQTTYTRPFSSNTTDATVNKHPKAEKVKTVEEAVESISDIENLRGQSVEYVLRDEKGNNVNHLIDDLYY